MMWRAHAAAAVRIVTRRLLALMLQRLPLQQDAAHPQLLSQVAQEDLLMKKRQREALRIMMRMKTMWMWGEATATLMGIQILKTLLLGAHLFMHSVYVFHRTHHAFRDEISKCANMLAQTTLQVETLRAIIEDFSDEDQEPTQARTDHEHHHDVQVGFSIAASAEPHASLREPQHVVTESVSDDTSSASHREQEIISALDSCVQEMAALDPQEKLVHCATVLQVFLAASACGTVCTMFAIP